MTDDKRAADGGPRLSDAETVELRAWAKDFAATAPPMKPEVAKVIAGMLRSSPEPTVDDILDHLIEESLVDRPPLTDRQKARLRDIFNGPAEPPSR